MRVLTGVRPVAAILILALFAAGCGGDDEESAQTATPAPTTVPQSSVPEATTNEPPGARTGPPPEETLPPDDPERDEQGNEEVRPVGRSFFCEGRRQRVLSAAGPIDVDPRVVAPGGRFKVTITDSSARAALVQLVGITDKPIQSQARSSDGRLSATLRMPSRAPCGNKLIVVEGDVSGQAYVGVRR